MEDEIQDLLREFGISYKKNGKSFICACPKCNKKDKLYIRRFDGRFVCWYCAESENFQGRPEFALAELCSLPIKEVQERLYGTTKVVAQVHLQLDLKDFKDEEDDDFIEGVKPMTEVIFPLSFLKLDQPGAELGMQYALKRGITPDLAEVYDLRYQPSTHRLIFPVQHKGTLYGWQGRLVDNDKPYYNEATKKYITPLKILTSEGLDRNRTVMFADRLTDSPHAVLTEGPVSAIHAHLCGGNIASMGKVVSKAQLELLKNSGCKELFMGLDPDAFLEIMSLASKADMSVRILRPPEKYGDLGEMPLDEVKALFDAAPRFLKGQVILYLKNHFGAQ